MKPGEMALSIGTRIGVYEVVAGIGAGAGNRRNLLGMFHIFAITGHSGSGAVLSDSAH